jgi:lipopolysaccharide/colanic/teichoic acid biosynthesis glycosyltransferase
MNRVVRASVYVVIPIVVAGLSHLHGSVLAPNPYEFVRTGRLAWAAAYAVLLMVACYVVGLPGTVRSARSALLQASAAVTVAALGISAVQLVVGDALLPRLVVFGSAAVVVPLVAGLSYLYRVRTDRNPSGERVFFVGAETERVRLEEELAAEPERPATLVGWHEPRPADPAGVELVDAIERSTASLLVLDLRSQADECVVGVAVEVHEQGIRVRTLSLFYEEWLGKLPVSELERVSLLFDVGELHRVRYARAKRIVDVLLAALGMLVLVIVTPAVYLGNRIANRGPLLFRQDRVGKGGEVFEILKFRTMTPGTDDGTWTQQSDPRVTSFGRFLRLSHVDELPQMVNILRGDLSLVGPRPEQPRYVDELAEKLPFYGVRHLVRPGLTGWAQVKYGYAGDERDALEKLQYEFYYLRRQGLMLDLRILGRTARHVVDAGGR